MASAQLPQTKCGVTVVMPFGTGFALFAFTFGILSSSFE
jgi:hypothetical protein